MFDPVSNLLVTVDPTLPALLDEVSEQNLFAFVNTLAGFGSRHTLSETQLGDYGIGAARRWIHDEFVRVGSGTGRLEVTYDDFRLNYAGLISEQRNVVATLPGTSSNPGAIVFMAHYDSRSEDVANAARLAPGADDNATGVAIMLELARLMSARLWPNTILFIAFAAEEQGTFGSKHFVQDRMLDGALFDAAIANDIVGGRPGIPQNIRLFSSPEEFSNGRMLARYMEYVGSVYLPGFPAVLQDSLDRTDLFGARYSDHREFVNAGVPGVRLTESEEDLSVQHTSQDTADLIDYAYLRKAAQLNLAVAANLAAAPPAPPPPTVSPMADPGSFIVTWTPDPLVSGYAVSFRPVGSQLYAPFRFVGRENAGNVALTGFDPATPYAVSLAALDPNGRIGLFSSEVIVEPTP